MKTKIASGKIRTHDVMIISHSNYKSVYIHELHGFAFIYASFYFLFISAFL